MVRPVGSRLVTLAAAFALLMFPLLPVAAQASPRPSSAASAPRTAAKPARKPAPVSFTNDIVPLLTRAGCSMGTCHGAQYGKGGFKLSLAGYDPDFDHQQIARQVKGRRLALADPTRSLLLRKPAMAVPHGGGRRLEPGSSDYALLARWIAEGAPGPNPAHPTVVKLEVSPAERVLPQGSAPLRLTVRAAYSDGSTRDVTAHTRLNSLNDGIAACTPEGVITAVGKGQTAIMARYADLAAISTIIVPFKTLPAASAKTPRVGKQALPTPNAQRLTPNTPSTRIDALVASKQRQIGLEPSPLCDDRTFLRRASFDLIGTPPTPEEIAAFLADKSPNRRAKWIDALLARPEYADYWTLKWGDLLRSSRANLGGAKGMWSFTNWIRAQMRDNRPIDQFARELILAQGSTYTNGPSNYYRVAREATDRAETTAQVFLGVRLQCAKCHNHPFEKWTQKDYYQFAAFFARVGLKGSQEFGLFGGEEIVRVNDDGEVYHPKTGAKLPPMPLGVKLAANSEGSDPDAGGDRRRALADWLTSKSNPLFARNIANRAWSYLFGKGIVNPVDDLRVTNPPTNPVLLDFLASEFVRSGYDMKHLLRIICNTQTYQRSSEATPGNKKDEWFFTHYPVKRLPAESLLDAIDFACGTQEKFPNLPGGVRAIQLPDPQVGSEFLDVFGRPARTIACECERVAEPNLSQTLRLMNGELVNRKVAQGDGRIAKLMEAKKPDRAILRELYLVTVGRPPNRREQMQILGVLAFGADHKTVFEDVLMTLLNSKEFLFNH